MPDDQQGRAIGHGDPWFIRFWPWVPKRWFDEQRAEITRLRTVVRLSEDALAHHSDWCGHYANASGHPSYNRAWDAIEELNHGV